jgi:hypothetical protein
MTYSENALKIYERLYYNGNEKTPEEVHARVAEAIGNNDEEIFKFEEIMNEGAFRPSSPILINAGVPGKNPWDNQFSSCFVMNLDDSMESIIEMWSTCAKIFAGGSGAGIPITNLREKGSPLSKGGTASGSIEYLKVIQSVAETVKSGGRCLSGEQKVYTNLGIKTVKKLAEQGKFILLSFDLEKNRTTAKWGIAFKSGVKQIYKVITDKGSFLLSEDHPVLTKTKEYIAVQNLKPNMRLFSCSPSFSSGGYVRIPLCDGKKTRILLHRLLAQDILQKKINKKVIHHKNHNNLDNSIENLELIENLSEHSYYHGKEMAELGAHVFQRKKMSHKGTDNGMHHNSAFWKNKRKVNLYKTKQGKILQSSDRASEMAKIAIKQRMLNDGYCLINSGKDISNFYLYYSTKFENWKRKFNPCHVNNLKKSIQRWFGSYENFYKEINAGNNTVLQIIPLQIESVYDIEVLCNSPNDLTNNDSHNFLIMNCDSNKKVTGNGIFVHNSRRAALLASAKCIHPQILEIIKSKQENKLSAFNISILVDDYFMNLKPEETYNLVSPNRNQVVNTVSKKEVWDEIVNCAWNTGDPGLLFEDTSNRFNPLPSITGRVVSTNP